MHPSLLLLSFFKITCIEMWGVEGWDSQCVCRPASLWCTPWSLPERLVIISQAMTEWLEGQPNMMIFFANHHVFYFLLWSYLSVKLPAQENLMCHACLFANLVFGWRKIFPHPLKRDLGLKIVGRYCMFGFRKIPPTHN